MAGGAGSLLSDWESCGSLRLKSLGLCWSLLQFEQLINTWFQGNCLMQLVAGGAACLQATGSHAALERASVSVTACDSWIRDRFMWLVSCLTRFDVTYDKSVGEL